jgi:deoxyguanosine kinase
VPFRYIAIEGPIGVGKTRLAQRLASRIDGTTVLEDTENPFLGDFYNDRPGSALQAQLFYLLNRHRQLINLRQADLFHHTVVCDYLFDKDKIFAYLNLVIYLQAPSEVLLKRLKSHPSEHDGDLPQPDPEYLRELNEAYQHFFFHYSATPLLVVETSQFDADTDDAALDDLVKQISSLSKGTRYYVPRTKRPG